MLLENRIYLCLYVMNDCIFLKNSILSALQIYDNICETIGVFCITLNIFLKAFFPSWKYRKVFFYHQLQFTKLILTSAKLLLNLLKLVFCLNISSHHTLCFCPLANYFTESLTNVYTSLCDIPGYPKHSGISGTDCDRNQSSRRNQIGNTSS